MASSMLHTQALGTSYSDSFWDDQYKGVDIVLNKSRQSKESCEAIKRLYKSRAQIEEEYGDKLLKLIQSSEIGSLEEDTFAETLSHISSSLETTARAHIDLAQQLKDHLELPLDGFIKEQRDLRKVQQQQIEKSKQLKNLHETDVVRAREYYASERSKQSVMEAQFASLEDDEGSINFEKEIEEQRRMVAVAEQVYKRSTESYNRINEKWISDWKKASSIFQDMEIKRINYLRNTLWTYSNMMTNTFGIDEDCCDRIRTALEITDVEKDILGFVQRYGTSTKIPAPIYHESLYTTSLSNSQISLSAPTPKTSLDSQTRNHSAITKSDSFHRSSSSQPPAPPPVTILTNPDEELKSVDHQLQQLEVVGTPKATHPIESALKSSEQTASPQSPVVIAIKENEPLSGVTGTSATSATQSHGAVSTAMKEVEHMLNQGGSQSELNKREIIPYESQLESLASPPPPSVAAAPAAAQVSSQVESAHIVDTPEDLSMEHTSLPQLIENNTSNMSAKYKPLPNPSFEKKDLTDNNNNDNNNSNVQDKDMTHAENKAATKKYLPELLPLEEPTASTTITTAQTQKDKSNHLQQENNDNNTGNGDGDKKDNDSDDNDNDDDDDDDDDKEEKEIYKSRLPRSTPKDEKWVISSIRRPQQLPVRAMNAKMFDGNNAVNRNSMSPPITSQIEHPQVYSNDEEKHENEVTHPARQPKLHRPIVPLTIDIPNSINKTPSHPNIHSISQEATLEGNRRHSHPSPVQQQPTESVYNTVHHIQQHQQQQPTDRNMIRNYINQTNSNTMNNEIRPAPWFDERGNIIHGNEEQQHMMANNGHHHPSYYGNLAYPPQQQQQQQQQYVGPRNSSLKMNPEQLQQLHHDLYQNDEDNSKKRMSSAPLPAVVKFQNEKQHKDSKSGRFSLPFFSGKKDKKKEKELSKEPKEAITSSAPNSFYGNINTTTSSNNNSYRSPSSQDLYHNQRPQSQQMMYQIPQQQQQQQQQHMQSQQQQPQLPQEIIESAAAVPESSQENHSGTENQKYIGYARALWPFEANIKEEMSFQVGDTVGVIRRQADGWWEAELTKQGVVYRGLVPGNYMETIQP